MLIKKARGWMKNVLGIKDVYIFQNEDTDHGFHVRMFPRFDRMEQFGRKVESIRPIMNYAKQNMMNQSNISQMRKYVEKMILFRNQKK